MHLTIKPTESHFLSFPRSLPSPPSESEFGYELERSQHSPPSKFKRRMLPLKKQRQPVMDDSRSTSNTPRDSTPVLTPCHVCYKAPRLKSELDAFEDCLRCQERTCFICMRQCQAGCDRRKVCRGCCVEQGRNGDVSCLDCLQHSHDEEMAD